MKNMLRLLWLLKPYTGWMLLGIFLSLVTVLSNIALMAIAGWFIASMAIAGAAGVGMNFFTPAAMIRATAILRTIGRYGERLVTHEATFRVLATLRVWFYSRLEPLVPQVIEEHRSGDLFSRIQADIDQLDNFYLRIVVPLGVALIAVSLVTLIAMHYHHQLGWVLLTMLVFAGVFLPWLMYRLGRRPGEEQVLRSAALRTAVIDGVQGLPELIVSGAAKSQKDRIIESSRRLITTQRRMNRVAGLSTSAMILSSNLTLWLVVVIAVPLVGSGVIKPPELAMLALFTLSAFEAVMPLPDAFSYMGQIRLAASRLYAIVDRQPSVPDPAVAADKPTRFEFRLDNICFSYDGRTPVLTNIDLDITPGKKIAIAGPSGSGKSSLIQLLLRYRKADSGDITLDGVSVSAYHGDDLRRWIAVVPQQVYLFNSSIRDNLRLAKPDASDDDLNRACRQAQLETFIAQKPEGYQSWVGETGLRLSGGQARRLGIARALVREHELLILDEPTEGLDSATAKHLIDSITRESSQRSLLMITHQLVCPENFDEIIVLDQGRIIERGTHANLLKRKGRYVDMFAL